MLLVVLILLSVIGVAAQSNERAYENVQFRTVTPGARAVAMGKAFVGIADDATAAATNPAGLSNLADTEISAEWSATELRHSRLGSFVASRIDPTTTVASSSVVSEPTFFSVVSPFPWGTVLQNVTVAGFYNSLHRYSEQFDIPNVLNGERLTEGGYAGETQISARAVGVAGALLLGSQISVGGGLTVRRLTNYTRTGGYTDDTRPPLWSQFRSGTVTDDSDTAVGGQIGVLFKNARGISVGGSYLTGSTFTLTTQIFGVFSPENSPPLPPRPVEEFTSPVQQIDYRLPSRLTAGIAFRTKPWLLLLSDVAFVRYSERITKRFLIVDFLAQPSSKQDATQYVLHDAFELHAGAELKWNTPIGLLAARAGFFTDPPHQMRFDERYLNPSQQAKALRIRFNSLHTDTVYGGSIGAGIVIANRLQIDAAWSASSNASDLVVSSVVRFPH